MHPELVNRAAYLKERTIVSKRGKDIAAIVPIGYASAWTKMSRFDDM